MNVNKVAAELGKLGLNISKIISAEFEDCEDHQIQITENISIQVGSLYNYMSVTHQVDEENFMMYPERKSLKQIVVDVRTCLGLVAASNLLAEDLKMKTNFKVKTYSRRDSAVSVLRKIGIQARDYNLFITKSADGVSFICHFEEAEKHLADLKSKPSKKSVTNSTKPITLTPVPIKERRESKERREKDKRTVSSVARTMVLDGCTNSEIWAILKEEFSLDDTKKGYPAWYRADAKRRGLLVEA